MRPIPSLLQTTPGRTPCPTFTSTCGYFRGNVNLVDSRTTPLAKSRSGYRVRTTELDNVTVGKNDPEPQETVEKGDEPFDWNKAWYPVALERDLNPLAPKRVELLGREFVLWNANGDWRCFEDVCPHRLAPLSEGRIEPSDGSLMCSYHGWRFDGEGSCVNIPQVRMGPQDKRSPCKNPRSKAKSFPVKTEGEMVWVWPDASPSAYIDSSMVEPVYADFDPETSTEVGPLFYREANYPIDILLENTVDPSHVPYSHHGVRGDRDTVGWMEAKLEEVPEGSPAKIRVGMESLLLLNKRGKSSKVDGKGEGKKEPSITRRVEFFEPSTVVYEFLQEGNRSGTTMVLVSVPISAQKSRVYYKMVLNRTLPGFANLIFKITRPVWRSHLENNDVLDGDMVLLKAQGEILREAAKEGHRWSSKYYIPSSADLLISQFRRWFHSKRGGGGPKFPNGESFFSASAGPPMDKRQIMDRYHTHTKDCKVCSVAMRNFGLLEEGAKIVSAVLGVVAVTMVQALVKGNGGAGWGALGGVVVGALVAFYVSLVGKDMRQRFVYTGYEHWNK